MRPVFAVLFTVALLTDFEVKGDADAILAVFLQAIDKLAPADKVQDIKAKVMKTKPCLEHIVQNAGDEAVQRYTQSIVPMSVKCKMVTAAASDEKLAHKKFKGCMKKEMDKFMQPLSDSDKAAFDATHKCIKEIDGEED